MKTYVKLAWRNIWRNKRRTVLTTASIVVAVVLAIFTRSMQAGTFENMITVITETYTGYIQIHKKGYWDNKTIDNIFSLTDSLTAAVSTIPGVTSMIGRLESFALASSEKLTRGVLVIGIEPRIEDSLTALGAKMIAGYYLAEQDTAVLVAKKLAAYLRISVGDTLILLSQGYHGISAAARFPVRGIIRLPNPELNKQLVYMPLSACQEFYSAPGMISSLAINISLPDHLYKVHDLLASTVDASQYEVMTWEEIFPELVQHMKLDTAGAMIMLAILYIIAGFGIFGTVTMMTLERMREFAVMQAIGMKKKILSIVVSLETLFIGLLGACTGILVAIPLIRYFYLHPIPITGEAAKSIEEFGIQPLMYMSTDPGIFINHSIIVFILALVCTLFPLCTIASMNLIESLRK